MQAVAGRFFFSLEASVEGFARFMIKDRVYPGLTPAPAQITSGRLYYNVDSQSLNFIDCFEDEVYVREQVLAKTRDGVSIEAYAYIIPPEHRHMLSSEPWRQDQFIAKDIHGYVIACQAFHREALRRMRTKPSSI